MQSPNPMQKKGRYGLQKKAVLFDFDGTLFLGTPELNAWCFEQALTEMALPPATPDMIDRTIGMTFHDIACLMTRSRDEALLRRFEETTFRAVPSYIRRHVREDAGVLAMLDALRPHTRLAICSNAASSYLNPMTEALNLRGRMDEIWFHHPGVTKAQAIPILMGRLGAKSAVFVGDRTEDILSAREAGIPVVGIRNRAYPWEADAADAVVTSHAEMTGAIFKLLDLPDVQP